LTPYRATPYRADPVQGQHTLPDEQRLALVELPRGRRRDWAAWVDRSQTAAEEAAIGDAISRSRPYGDDAWLGDFKKTLGWREPLPRGRPKKQRKSR
jgi:hypothetical protein